ncbi:acyl-CoA N-acyltransferase [Melanogaster broomeanus]|nr:acyl-CoA N-acyltransferase [Melanogaster broomeanus]
MVFVNNYSPEPEISEEELYGPEPYDLNFILPVPQVLSTDKLRLVPFIPRVHAAAYFEAVRGHETIYQFMSVALEHPSDFLRFIEMCRRDKTAVVFAVIDTTRLDPNTRVGGLTSRILGLLETDKTNLVTEIGPAIVLPAFQRTHVASHAVGLLLKRILDIAPSGLGFRKVKWVASPSNLPSNKLAQRMGFKFEGLIRWAFVMPRVEGYQKRWEGEHPSDFLRFIEMCRRDKTAVVFAVIDTTRLDPKHPEWEGSLAGILGLLETDKTNLVTEIGPAIVLPAFQRTHVAPCRRFTPETYP